MNKTLIALVVRFAKLGTNETDVFFRQARRRLAAVWGIRQGDATPHGGKRRRFMSAVWRNGLLTLTGTLSVSAFAADSYTIDSRHTFPSFEVSHLGFSIQRGRFNNSAGKITLDTAAKSGSIAVTIDTASISTGLTDLEKHLQGEDFFDAAKYPTITFTSKSLKFDGDKLIGANGDFTLHGVTKPVSLQIDHFHCAPHPMNKKPTCGANATTTIKRSEFGIVKYVPAVGDEVKIIIQVEALKD